jgi:micrococcal nuclease
VRKKDPMDKRLPLVFLVAFVALSFTPLPTHVVKSVFDGDTILLKNGYKIRYLGVDSPEMGEKPEHMAVEALELNRTLVSGKRVRLEFDRVQEDRYGRKLCYVFLDGGEMVNAVLVRRGLAHVLASGTDIKYFQRLLDAQRLAMQERIGIWSREAAENEKLYAGNTGSLVFHRPRCDRGKEIARQNRRTFPTRLAAFWEGYHPCRICRP